MPPDERRRWIGRGILFLVGFAVVGGWAWLSLSSGPASEWDSVLILGFGLVGGLASVFLGRGFVETFFSSI